MHHCVVHFLSVFLSLLSHLSHLAYTKAQDGRILDCFNWLTLLSSLTDIGILYCNGAHASTESVAIMALYQIISVFRHMTRSALAARSNSPIKWREAHEKIPFVARDPTRHTLGIIGLGNIGHAVARKVKAAFDMKIIYHDVFQKTPELERQVDATYYPTLEAMLPRSDCVLIATPHTGRPLLNARTLALLPAGARVVNIARGICIDEDALADALESQHISAAGLDVHAHEPNVSPRLSKMDNVTLTSHTGGGSIETAVEFERLVMQNVDAVLQGRPALTAVNQGLVDGCLSRKRNGNGVVVNGGAESLSASTNGETLVNGVVANGIGKVNGSASTAVGNT